MSNAAGYRYLPGATGQPGSVVISGGMLDGGRRYVIELGINPPITGGAAVFCVCVVLFCRRCTDGHVA